MIGARLTLLLVAMAVLTGAVLVLARSDPPPATEPIAKIAQDSCTAHCNAQWNACRMSTKGSAACDAQRAACMQACLPPKK